MNDESFKLTIKKSHLQALAVIILLIAVSYFAYNYGKGSGTANDTGNGNSEDLFVQYAKDLDLDTKKFEACLDSGKYTQEVLNDLQTGTITGVTGTPAFIINGNFIEGAQSYSMFKEIFDAELKNASNKSAADSLISKNDPVKGNESAPITLIEFSDFQCPYCAASAGVRNNVYLQLQRNDPKWQPEYPNVMENYVKTGKVKYVFKDYPLPPQAHPKAQKAAEAAQCANEQGKFWEYHDKLYETQDEWAA